MILNFVEISSLTSHKTPASVLMNLPCPFRLCLEDFKNSKLKCNLIMNCVQIFAWAI